MRRLASVIKVLVVGCLLAGLYSYNVATAQEKGLKESDVKGTLIAETWMGVYMNGVKIGYSHDIEKSVPKAGKNYIQTFSESRIQVSRMGGSALELITIQESLHDDQENPVETVLRTKMSENETVISTEVGPEAIVFKLAGKVVKELPYSSQNKIYVGVPLEKICREKGLAPGDNYSFKIIDPIAYTLSDCRCEIIGEEDVLILGEKMRLWRVRSEMASIVPIEVDEWIDKQGKVFKMVMQSGFLSTVSLRMPKEKALESSQENLDIVFSSVIKPNINLPHPQAVREITMKISGVPLEKLKEFPWDDSSQKVLQTGPDYLLIRTSSDIFLEEESLFLPIQEESLQDSLASTPFCQSDDPGIIAVAKEIVGAERNAWRAAKKIAEWVEQEITPNYNVGFASAVEILKNREGDCTEHTVIFVALCRASGIPARAAVGVMYGSGIFAYHMWPEVYVGRWVDLDAKWLARDEKTGEYYTDATHIKFGRSDLDENLFQEMITSISEIMGKLQVEILEYKD